MLLHSKLLSQASVRWMWGVQERWHSWCVVQWDPTGEGRLLVAVQVSQSKMDHEGPDKRSQHLTLHLGPNFESGTVCHGLPTKLGCDFFMLDEWEWGWELVQCTKGTQCPIVQYQPADKLIKKIKIRKINARFVWIFMTGFCQKCWDR